MKNGKRSLSSFDLALSEGVKDFAEEMAGKRNKNERGDKSIRHTDLFQSEKKFARTAIKDDSLIG
jgi:hypothetical protein